MRHAGRLVHAVAGPDGDGLAFALELEPALQDVEHLEFEIVLVPLEAALPRFLGADDMRAKAAAGRMGEVKPNTPLPGPPLGFVQGPADLLVDAPKGTPLGEGEFAANGDIDRQRGASSSCEVISGQWKDLRSGRSVPFELALSSIQTGKIDHLYGAAGVSDDETVNRAATQFRKGVLDDRRDVVAQSIRYPLHVSLRGKTLILRNPKSLLARYNEIFTDGYVRTIGAAVPRLMFARDQGVMLGDGAVWFDANGRVIALNRY